MNAQQDSLAEHRRTSYELWQRMAEPWQRRRELAWRWTRPVSEWLVERLDPRPGQTVLELAGGTGETGFLAAYRLGQGGRLISSDYAPDGARRRAGGAGAGRRERRVPHPGRRAPRPRRRQRRRRPLPLQLHARR